MTLSRTVAEFLLAAFVLGAMVPVGIARADGVDYERDIKPMLKARCYACHGALKQEAGLRLDTGGLIRQGGDSGAAVEVGQPDASLLLEKVIAEELGERMPPEGEPLSAVQIEGLREWILDGANSPESEQAEADPREHWAFQPPRRPAVPSLESHSSGTNPIDAFLEAELVRRGLTPRPAAAKQVLLRRVYLDLIGLPPTREELQAFLSDESPAAYEKVVERLLSDERYGERWGRHWMDVWRYSDWYGRRDANDVRNSASQIFRWRDWIVRSLNTGTGYDRMLQAMLAADELFPDDYDAGVATGYLIRNYYSLNQNDWMRNTVEHTGKAFLGLTFNCAHCHDHKYDPIEHDDYFRLRAFFEPLYIRQDRVVGEPDPGPFEDYVYAGSRSVQRLGAVRVYDRQLDAPTWFYTEGDERNRVAQRGSIAPGVPVILQSDTFVIEPLVLPPVAWYPGLRPEMQEATLAAARQLVATAEQSLASSPVPDVAPTDELAQAEAAYAQALQRADTTGPPATLAGEQSLLLDATAGRAIIENGLSPLATLVDGLTISFDLLILHDAHFNFQLLRDNQQGLTAGYIGWEQGRILTYKTDEAASVEVGKYDLAAGQTRFEVALELQPTTDEAFLTVRSVTDAALLVDRVSTRLGGWMPIGNDVQTIAFDARPGSVVAIDRVQVWASPTGTDSAAPLLALDFEPPQYTELATPVGSEGWLRSAFAEAGGVAIVSLTAGNRALHAAAEQLQFARRKAAGPHLRRQATEAQVAAARAGLASWEARIAAERARYIEPVSTEALSHLMRTASGAERQAKWLRAQSNLLAQDAVLLDAETRPADDPQRAPAIKTARQGLATAGAAVETARAALSDEKLAEIYEPLSPQFPRESSGRRRALALWITSPANPLTARVAVNHLWMRHFRTPLVASVFDFGRNGAPPTHPELLDWLAVEFMESGWDMKHLHRLLVTSAAYRRASSVGDAHESVTADPENKLLWRMNSWRMESEVLRDSLLAVAGRLDLRQGGIELENKDALTTNRRTLYYSSFPESGGKSALGELFDAPDPLDCYRRTSSIVPQQALALTNSDLVHQASAAIVAAWQEPTRLASADEQADATAQFIEELFARILCRSPRAEERRLCRDILDQQQQLTDDPQSAAALTQAYESLTRILLNHNDFVIVR